LEQLQGLLYAVSSAFLLPVLVGVVLAFVYATYLVGQFLSEALDRRANRASLEELYAGRPTRERFLALPWKVELARFRRIIEAHHGAEPLVEKQVVDLENQMRRRVERLGILGRIGPILGLVGTLIPLQPALAGLARGDMQTVGANLLIGFTTTVVGLLVGGTCYAISVVVRNWYQQDVTEMHFLLDQWLLDPWHLNPSAETPASEAEVVSFSHERIQSMAAAARGPAGLEGPGRPLR
jgi:biopolymer transport protein ExbB/TolQ